MILMVLKILGLIALWLVLLLAIGLINIAGKCSREEEKAELEREMKKHGK